MAATEIEGECRDCRCVGRLRRAVWPAYESHAWVCRGCANTRADVASELAERYMAAVPLLRSLFDDEGE